MADNKSFVLDESVFMIESQTSANDKRSLLFVQSLIRSNLDSYSYLEIGSHLGGTLVPHLLDPKCNLVVSVDIRTVLQPDIRGRLYEYPMNSTSRMINALRGQLGTESLSKLRTFDFDISHIPALNKKIDLFFIDAEHTNIAAFKDFCGCRQHASSDHIILFHDSNLIIDSLLIIRHLLTEMKIDYCFYILPDDVAVFTFNNYAALLHSQLNSMNIFNNAYIDRALAKLHQSITMNLISPCVDFSSDEKV